jgi:hypothetical protein
MIFKRTLQRESDSSNRTITIEDGALPLKYIVVVYGEVQTSSAFDLVISFRPYGARNKSSLRVERTDMLFCLNSPSRGE